MREALVTLLTGEAEGGFTDTLHQSPQGPTAEAEALVAGKLPQRHAVDSAVQKANGSLADFSPQELPERGQHLLLVTVPVWVSITALD